MTQKVRVSPDLLGGDVDEGYGRSPTRFAATSAVEKRSVPPSRSIATAARLSICGEVSATGSRKRRGNTTPS